jgi:hypothetical protein
LLASKSLGCSLGRRPPTDERMLATTISDYLVMLARMETWDDEQRPLEQTIPLPASARDEHNKDVRLDARANRLYGYGAHGSAARPTQCSQSSVLVIAKAIVSRARVIRSRSAALCRGLAANKRDAEQFTTKPVHSSSRQLRPEGARVFVTAR